MDSYKCCRLETAESQGILAQSALLKLIAEESRLKLLCILHQGSHCVSELTRHLDMSQSLISHHLADLRTANLVNDTKNGRQVYYSLTHKGKRVMTLLTTLTRKDEV